VSTNDPPATRGYRPGSWFGVFGDHATVLLPPSEKERVAGLWAVVDEGAGFDVVLDALISGGLRELPAFLLVSTEDDVTKMVVRGEVRVRFTTADGEQVTLDGTEASTWAERSLTAVTATRIDVGTGDEQGGPLLPILGGLVRVGSVEEPPAVAPEPTPAPDPDPVPEPASEPAPAPAPEPLTEAMPLPEPEPEPEPQPQPDLGPDTEPDPEPDPGPDPGPDTDPDPVAPSPVARLVFSHGDDVEVDGAVLVGRAPEPRRSGTDGPPRLVRVPSPQQEISSTHLEIRPGTAAARGSAVVTDLGSTNGTVLVQPGLPPEDLRPGIAVELVPGAVLDLGDGVTISVVNP
jgi:RNase P/RNase MRP subunit p29